MLLVVMQLVFSVDVQVLVVLLVALHGKGMEQMVR